MTRRPASRILLIVDNGGPGDALRAAFCVPAVRRSHPSAHIALLVDARARPVFERSKACDRVLVSRLYTLRHASPLRLRLQKAKELVRLACALGSGYDLVITFGYSTTVLTVFGWMVGRHKGRRAAELLRALVRKPASGAYDDSRSIVEHNRSLVEAAGMEPPATAATIIHDEQDDATVRRLLADQGLEGSPGLTVLHTGSDWACQQWLPERWAALADRLVMDYGAALVFTGLAGEQPYIEAIRARMRAPSTSLAGHTTLAQLGALLARARLCVCVDSAVYELAQAAGIACVVLAGPTYPAQSVVGRRLPVIVNRTTAELTAAINKCKEPKDLDNGCLNYDCPMAGLRDIALGDVLHAVEEQGALKRAHRPIPLEAHG